MIKLVNNGREWVKVEAMTVETLRGAVEYMKKRRVRPVFGCYWFCCMHPKNMAEIGVVNGDLIDFGISKIIVVEELSMCTKKILRRAIRKSRMKD